LDLKTEDDLNLFSKFDRFDKPDSSDEEEKPKPKNIRNEKKILIKVNIIFAF
jgi:hypothetical protein